MKGTRSFLCRKQPRWNSRPRCRTIVSNNNNKDVHPNVDIVQGPSLLRTSLHRPSPSLVHLPGLRSLPFWTQLTDTNTTRVAYQDPQLQSAVHYLEEHASMMAHEYHQKEQLSVLPPSDYQSPKETEHNQLHTGQWDWHSFLLKGKVQPAFCEQFPETATILHQLRHDGMLFEGTPFGYSFFSTLHPQSKIAAHTSPINFRIRVHLPLQVPTEPTNHSSRPTCGIRVGPTTRTWTKGKALLLDDSYEHEVWNEDTTQKRVILLVDLWHPDVTMQERKEIVAMFDHAQKQGWWSNWNNK